MKAKPSTQITFNELMSELDKYRIKPQHRKLEITEEQEAFIRKCRLPLKKVPYDTMVSLWKKLGWGEICNTSIRRRCALVLKREL